MAHYHNILVQCRAFLGERERPHSGRCSDAPGLAKAEGVGVAPRIPTLGAEVNSSATKLVVLAVKYREFLTVTEICT